MVNVGNSTLALASATWKGLLREKIFYAVIIIAFLILGFSYVLATLTLVESRKLMLDFGFAAISISGLMIAAFVGIYSIAKEIETKTVYTVLSKPVSRASFLLGKFFGCFSVLAVTHLLLGLVLLGVLFLAGETAPRGFAETIFLTLLENSIILAAAFFFSIVTRGFLAGSFTFAVFLIGRGAGSLYLLAQKGGTPEVRTVAHALYWIAPNLERYNIRDVVAYGKDFPSEMIPHAVLYTLLYLTVCLSAAIFLLEKKEIQ